MIEVDGLVKNHGTVHAVQGPCRTGTSRSRFRASCADCSSASGDDSACSARDAIVPSIRVILDRRDVTPGLMVSIQTFGSYAANFNTTWMP
jgi:hypothetical protein